MKNQPDKLPGNTLTVVIRNDSPMFICQDAPSYRSVKITLTKEQQLLLSLECTGSQGSTPIYEVISKCFIEPTDDSRT